MYMDVCDVFLNTRTISDSIFGTEVTKVLKISGEDRYKEMSERMFLHTCLHSIMSSVHQGLKRFIFDGMKCTHKNYFFNKKYVVPPLNDTSTG